MREERGGDSWKKGELRIKRKRWDIRECDEWHMIRLQG